MTGSRKHARCECYDRTDGHLERCENVERLRTLYRIDMEDRSGTAFCALCYGFAAESGLFRS